MKKTVVKAYALAFSLVYFSPFVFAQVTSTWNNTTGNWSDPLRWNTAFFPNNGNGGNDYNAVINGDTVTLDQDIEIEGLTLGGATLTGEFDLLLNGSSSWAGGTMSGTGTTTIAEGATLLLSHGSLGRQLVNNGTTNWTPGGLDLHGVTFQNNGTFTATSGDSRGISGTNTLNNVGTFIKQGSGGVAFYSVTGSGMPLVGG